MEMRGVGGREGERGRELQTLTVGPQNDSMGRNAELFSQFWCSLELDLVAKVTMETIRSTLRNAGSEQVAPPKVSRTRNEGMDERIHGWV